MNYLMIRIFAVLLLGSALMVSGCNYKFKSHSEMTDRDKAQVFSILQEEGASGLSYDDFNTLSEPR